MNGWCIFSVWVDAQSSKVLRSRQIGFEGQILSRLFSDYDEYTRPPVRGCNPYYLDIPFIVCFADSADHSSIVVITSLFVNRVQWHQHDAVSSLPLWPPTYYSFILNRPIWYSVKCRSKTWAVRWISDNPQERNRNGQVYADCQLPSSYFSAFTYCIFSTVIEVTDTGGWMFLEPNISSQFLKPTSIWGSSDAGDFCPILHQVTLLTAWLIFVFAWCERNQPSIQSLP